MEYVGPVIMLVYVIGVVAVYFFIMKAETSTDHPMLGVTPKYIVALAMALFWPIMIFAIRGVGISRNKDKDKDDDQNNSNH